MESTKFYATKLEGLKIIRGYMVAIDRVLADLVRLEDEQPGGDSMEEYCALRVDLDTAATNLEDHINAVEATLEYAQPAPRPTASQVMAIYAACLR